MRKNPPQNIEDANDDDDFRQAIKAQLKFAKKEMEIKKTAPKIGDFVMAKIVPKVSPTNKQTHHTTKQPKNPLHKAIDEEVFGIFLQKHPDGTIFLLSNSGKKLCTNPRLIDITNPITQKQVKAIQNYYNRRYKTASETTPESSDDPNSDEEI